MPKGGKRCRRIVRKKKGRESEQENYNAARVSWLAIPLPPPLLLAALHIPKDAECNPNHPHPLYNPLPHPSSHQA